MPEEPMTPQEIARRRLQQIFRYLSRFNELRNPVVRDIDSQPWALGLRELPEHTAVIRGRDAVSGELLSDEYILKVNRPDLSDPPAPPDGLRAWLKSGWDSPDRAPEFEEQRTETDPGGQSRSVPFEADPRRVTMWQAWLEVHHRWAEKERPARRAMALFEQMYALRSRLDREGERLELLVGDGLVTWDPKGTDPIRHPILLQRLQLVFRPDEPAFLLVETDHPPEFYGTLFQAVPGVTPTVLRDAQNDLQRDNWNPLGGEETASFFRRVVQGLSPRGRYIVSGGDTRDRTEPTIRRAPVLFLRNRSLGFSRALQEILLDLEHRQDLPGALTSLVGIEPPTPNLTLQESSGDDSPNGEDEEVFFTKPANPQQLMIARQLDQHGAVLVQGPPGTGKTHTIGNLIGHLLAQGKSVLVTSHTSKALQVLREQVVESLRPLCVSVLADNQSELESAIDAIADRLSATSTVQLEREATELDRERRRLLQTLRNTRAALRDARADEYRPVSLDDGTSLSPIDAARWVAEHRITADWIPGTVQPGATLPLSSDEVTDLYRTNRLVTEADERELAAHLPDPQSLPSPAEFTNLVSERTVLEARNPAWRPELWSGRLEHDPDRLLALAERIRHVMEPVGRGEPWRLAALASGFSTAQQRVWLDLVEHVRAVTRLTEEAELTMLRNGPQLPSGMTIVEIKTVLGEIVGHLDGGGKIGLMQRFLKPHWRRFVEAARVNGAPPDTRNDFETLELALKVQFARHELVQRWDRQMTPQGASEAAALGARPEVAALPFVAEIERALEWFSEQWAPVLSELKDQGLRWENLLAEVPIGLGVLGELPRIYEAAAIRVPVILSERAARCRWDQLVVQQTSLHNRLSAALGDGGPSGILVALRDACRTSDTTGYEQAYRRLNAVWEKQAAQIRRNVMLGRLAGVAPGWANAIRERDDVHGVDSPPGDPQVAWRWRQVHDELEQRGRASIAQLQKDIRRLSDALHDVTAQLVEKRAWAAQVRRTTLAQQHALMGYKQLMQRAGKGTSKRATRIMQAARNLMPECQSAVPVWVMPLSRVVENFDIVRNRFDVVIVDEASQADLLALTAVYLGRQVMVVGDHQQVSPLAVGVDLERMEHLIQALLDGVPNKELYDGLSSIYDMAQRSYKATMLVEHFRCVKPIIQFSNRLSYEGRIKPLRTDRGTPRKPATVAYRVRYASTHRHVNEREAVVTASLLVAATEQPEYAKATFGVISLLADEQARRIDQLLQRFLSPQEYERRRVRCGNSADFQGDERDVMFLSVVDAPGDGGPLAMRGHGANEMFRKRYNVAASRARDQLWVVHSLDPDLDLKPGDLRRDLIRHAMDPNAVEAQQAEASKKAESVFEVKVMERLIAAGYRVIPQWQVGAYRIDLVVDDGQAQLAVECDGERFHTEQNLREDMVRQAILERLGWKFERIRGSLFFRDPDAAMAPVFRRLRELGIRPLGPGEPGDEVDFVAVELRDRIVRRAEELRGSWSTRDPQLSDWVEEPVVDEAAAPASPAEVQGTKQTRKPLPVERLPERKSASNPTLIQAVLPLEAPPEPPRLVCRVGSHVVVRAPEGDEFEVQVVPAGKGDISRGTISADSPVGRAVLGKTTGAVARVVLPSGPTDYLVVDVRNIDD